MSTYLLNFTVYMAAMTGIIFLAVVVYKKFSYNPVSKSRFLDVEDCITLAPRKNLYVIRAGNEKFLVASDAERTSLISKLGVSQTSQTSVDELPSIVNFQRPNGSKKVFKNIVNNL